MLPATITAGDAWIVNQIECREKPVQDQSGVDQNRRGQGIALDIGSGEAIDAPPLWRE
jgi:hypothetical protein